MAEGKDQTLSDNLATPSPAQGSEGLAPTEGTTAFAAPEGDKFAGKSREEVLDMYKGLEGKYAEQGNELGQIRSGFSRVMPYFKLDRDPQTGEDSLVLNEEVIKALGQSYGWFEPQQTDNRQEQQMAIQNGNTPDMPYDKEELSALEALIDKKFKQFEERAVNPIQQQFVAAQQAQWVDQVAKKHPDFNAYRQKVGEFLNKTGMNVGSSEDLERAFIATKAVTGGMVDKRETEAYISELQKTLQTIQPGAGQPRTPVTEMTNEELFGLKPVDTPQARAFEELTGVRRYKE